MTLNFSYLSIVSATLFPTIERPQRFGKGSSPNYIFLFTLTSSIIILARSPIHIISILLSCASWCPISPSNQLLARTPRLPRTVVQSSGTGLSCRKTDRKAKWSKSVFAASSNSLWRRYENRSRFKVYLHECIVVKLSFVLYTLLNVI